LADDLLQTVKKMTEKHFNSIAPRRIRHQFEEHRGPDIFPDLTLKTEFFSLVYVTNSLGVGIDFGKGQANVVSIICKKTPTPLFVSRDLV